MNVRTHKSIQKAIAAVTDWNNLPLAKNVQITEGERASLQYITVTMTIREQRREFSFFKLPDYPRDVWMRVSWNHRAHQYQSDDLNSRVKKYNPSAHAVCANSVYSLVNDIRTYRSAGDAARAAIQSFV